METDDLEQAGTILPTAGDYDYKNITDQSTPPSCGYGIPETGEVVEVDAFYRVEDVTATSYTMTPWVEMWPGSGEYFPMDPHYCTIKAGKVAQCTAGDQYLDMDWFIPGTDALVTILAPTKFDIVWTSSTTFNWQVLGGGVICEGVDCAVAEAFLGWEMPCSLHDVDMAKFWLK